MLLNHRMKGRYDLWLFRRTVTCKIVHHEHIFWHGYTRQTYLAHTIHVCTYIHTHIHTYIHIHTYTHIHTYILRYFCIHTNFIYIYFYTCVCVCVALPQFLAGFRDFLLLCLGFRVDEIRRPTLQCDRYGIARCPRSPPFACPTVGSGWEKSFLWAISGTGVVDLGIYRIYPPVQVFMPYFHASS